MIRVCAGIIKHALQRKFAIVALIALIMLVLPNLAHAATLYGTIYDFSLEKIPNVIVTINTTPRQQIIADNATYLFNILSGSYTLTALKRENNRTLASAEENITITSDGTFRLDIILFPSLEEEESLLDISFEEDIASQQSSPSLITFILITAALLIVMLFILIRVYTIMKKYNLWKQTPQKNTTSHNGSDELIQNNEQNQKIASEAAGINEIDKENDDITNAEQKATQKATKAQQHQSQQLTQLPSDLLEIVAFIRSHGGRATQKELRRDFSHSEAKISLMLADLENRGYIKKIKKGRGNIIVLHDTAV